MTKYLSIAGARVRASVIGAVAAAAILVPTGLSLAGLVDFPSISIGEPTVTETNSVPLLIAIRNISDYHGATGTFSTLAERYTDNPGPDFLTGEHVTVYAVGTVDAVTSFAEVSGDNVSVSSDRRTVEINLPAPKLTPVALDPLETRVVNNDRGVVQRFNDGWTNVPDSHRDVLVQAGGQINLAAEQSDLMERGETSTRNMLVGLCNSLGYTDVTITFEPPILPEG